MHGPGTAYVWRDLAEGLVGGNGFEERVCSADALNSACCVSLYPIRGIGNLRCAISSLETFFNLSAMAIHVFISYADSDKGKMRSLERQLELHPALSAVIIADDRKPSTLLTDKVKTGIDECDYFVPILTGNSIKNQWVNQEIGYAVAKGKHIVPIVAKNITGKLKGFVHKQTDLSFQYVSARSKPSVEGKRFSIQAKVLVNWILTQNNIKPTDLSLESLFPGVWRLKYNYQGTGKIGYDENVEIRNGNQYYSNGKHFFNLEHFKVDLKKKTLAFTKRRPDPASPVAVNRLNIVTVGERYEGIESSDTPVVYYRINVGEKEGGKDRPQPASVVVKSPHQGSFLTESHIRLLKRGDHVFHRIQGKGTIVQIGAHSRRRKGRSVIIAFANGKTMRGLLNNSQGNYFEWEP